LKFEIKFVLEEEDYTNDQVTVRVCKIENVKY